MQDMGIFNATTLRQARHAGASADVVSAVGLAVAADAAAVAVAAVCAWAVAAVVGAAAWAAAKPQTAVST